MSIIPFQILSSGIWRRIVTAARCEHSLAVILYSVVYATKLDSQGFLASFLGLGDPKALPHTITIRGSDIMHKTMALIISEGVLVPVGL